MEGWRECTLGDVITLQRGFDITKAQQCDGVYPVVSSSGVKSFHDKCMVDGPGVVIGRKGTLGSVFYLHQSFWPHDTTLWVKNFHGNIPKFIYYYLEFLDFKTYDVGSSNPTLNRNHLHLLPVSVPLNDNQQAIAAVLSSLDDKIDLLHRQNKTLEAVAQTLFRQWFVEEADASFKEMPLKDLCLKIESGGTPKREVTEFWGGEIPWLTSGEVREPFVFSTKEYITLNGLSGSTAKIWDKGTVIVAMYGATAGVVCYTMIPLSANQACCGLKPKPEYEAFVYFYLSRNSVNLAEQATGSAQQNLNKGMIEAHTLLVANADKMLQFQLVAGKQLSMMGKNAKKICTLTKLRDTLLPKLMSGEVRVIH